MKSMKAQITDQCDWSFSPESLPPGPDPLFKAVGANKPSAKLLAKLHSFFLFLLPAGRGLDG